MPENVGARMSISSSLGLVRVYWVLFEGSKGFLGAFCSQMPGNVGA